MKWVITLIITLFPLASHSFDKVEEINSILHISDQITQQLNQNPLFKAHLLKTEIYEVHDEAYYSAVEYNNKLIALHDKFFSKEEISTLVTLLIREFYTEDEVDYLFEILSNDIGVSIFKKNADFQSVLLQRLIERSETFNEQNEKLLDELEAHRRLLRIEE